MRVNGEAKRLLLSGEQRVLGRLGRSDRDSQLGVRKPCDILKRRWLDPRGDRLFGGGRGRRGVSRAQRLLEPAQRLPELELPEHRAQLRAVGVG